MSHSKGHSGPLRYEPQNKGGTPENKEEEMEGGQRTVCSSVFNDMSS